MSDLEKNARKKSPDPIQEHLRAHKEHWNANTSKLVARLIAFKKALNGRGDPKLGLPPSNIKDPLPSMVESLLGQLKQDAGDVLSDAGDIIEEQHNYAGTRKKKVVASLNKEATNVFTRFWYKLFTSDEYKDYKISLINSCVDLNEDLKKLEESILSVDRAEFQKLIGVEQSIQYRFTSITYIFETLKRELDEKRKSLKQAPLGPQDNIRELENMENFKPNSSQEDIKSYQDYGIENPDKLTEIKNDLKASFAIYNGPLYLKPIKRITHLSRLVLKLNNRVMFLKSKPIQKPRLNAEILKNKEIYQEIVAMYDSTLKELSKQLDKYFSSYKELFSYLNSNPEALVIKKEEKLPKPQKEDKPTKPPIDELFSEASIYNDIKNNLLSLKFWDHTAPTRREIYKHCKKARETSKKVMTAIESKSDLSIIESLIVSLSHDVGRISNLLDVIYFSLKEKRIESPDFNNRKILDQEINKDYRSVIRPEKRDLYYFNKYRRYFL